MCLSLAEKQVTDFFIENNITYEKDVPYSKHINDSRCNSKTFDWYLPDYNIFVEYFGLDDKDHYIKKMEMKRTICRDNNIVLIELFKTDFRKNRLFEKFKTFIQ